MTERLAYPLPYASFAFHRPSVMLLGHLPLEGWGQEHCTSRERSG